MNQAGGNTVHLEVETVDGDLARDLVANASPDIAVTLKGESSRRGMFETQFILEFILEFASGVSSGIVTAFIMDAIHKRAKKVKVGGNTITDKKGCQDELDRAAIGGG